MTATGYRGTAPASPAAWSRCLQRGVDEIDELAHVLVLPAGAPLVHDVAEGHVRVRVGEPERAAGAEVTERAPVRSERALGHRELEAEPEARGPLQYDVLSVHLRLARAGDGLPREHV